MDERFMTGKKPPADALKSIGGGAKLTDINPQWRIEIMTEIYGLCGIGWKYEVGEPLIQNAGNDVMIFLPVSLYIKDNTTKEWSAPITAYGGDFLVKGNKGKEEGYKGCLTDALGKAMSYIGIASDIYRGCWDGSKYTNKTVVDSGDNNNDIPDNLKDLQNQLGGEIKKIYVRKDENGYTLILHNNGNWYALEAYELQRKVESLNALLNDERYKDAHAEIRMRMARMSAKHNE